MNKEEFATDGPALMQDLNQVYGLELPGNSTAGQMEEYLADKLNQMIRTDFSAVVQLLYRIDINENRLRKLLQINTGEDAGKIIARLIIERQWQKIQTRRQFGRQRSSTDEQEWKEV